MAGTTQWHGFAPQRLEQVLRLWEDVCAWKRFDMQVRRMLDLKSDAWTPTHGPVIHALEFRSAVRKRGVAAGEDERYVLDDPTCLRYLGPIATLPMALTVWSVASRRIFAISESLELLLAATSTKSISWMDTPWPFDSFAVALEKPLVDQNAGTYDTLLMGRYRLANDDGETTSHLHDVFLLSPHLDRAPRLDRPELHRLVARKMWQGAHDLLWNFRRNILDVLREHRLVLNLSVRSAAQDTVHQPKAASFIGLTQWTDEQALAENELTLSVGVIAARIVRGLALYLATLGGKKGPGQKWDGVPLPPAAPPNLITEDAQFCEVGAHITMDVNERDALGPVVCGTPPSRERSPHFRRGHWRRQVGSANDAAKIIWVKPCLVRADRLPRGALPRGATAELVVDKKPG